jgi:hypothetical protein
MPSVGVTTTFGAGSLSGITQSAEKSEEKEVATIRGADGKIATAIAKPRLSRTVSVKTKGEPTLSSVTVGDFSTLTLTSCKVSETNDDFPSVDYTYQQFE